MTPEGNLKALGAVRHMGSGTSRVLEAEAGPVRWEEAEAGTVGGGGWQAAVCRAGGKPKKLPGDCFYEKPVSSSSLRSVGTKMKHNRSNTFGCLEAFLWEAAEQAVLNRASLLLISTVLQNLNT